MLHSFGYEEARIAFNEAAKSDPACAMAYWGVARTWYHPIWAPPSPDELKQARKRFIARWPPARRTERERDYISALAVFYKDWQTVDHATRAKAYERALAKAQRTLSRRRRGCDIPRAAIGCDRLSRPDR